MKIRQSVSYRVLVGFAVLLFLGHLQAIMVQAEERPGQDLYDRMILVLHSYGPDYTWTINLNDGITSVFRELDWSSTVRSEYMDTKNIVGDEYYQQLAQIYRQKYAGVTFDAILATDNNAMLFLERFRLELFGDVPVVATGINGVGTIELPTGPFTIIPEEARHAETIRQALRVRPKSRDCYVLVDSTVTGRAIMSEVQAVEHEFEGQLQFHYIDGRSFEELMGFVALLNPDDLIYLLPFFRDAAENTFPQGNVATSLARVSPAPIFVSWEFQLDTGALGGAVVSGHNLGALAASTLLELLRGGEMARVVRLSEHTSSYTWDYQSLRRYNIQLEKLPPGSRFINRPPSFFARHKAVLVPAMVIITILVAFLLLILKMLNKETIINQNNQLILQLDKEVIDTQRELVATLGEVIETRSQETGNHVKRVARISRLLGERLGLSEEELEVLEAASPLHDVGKIGIPDSILNRPGQLSEVEFLKMQEHTIIGKDILRYSDRKLLSAACAIAYEHHERWDGTGYPEALCGHEIHIFARITALADVYDALSSDRCYKKAWPEEKVLSFIRNESGRFFDPEIVSVFFESFEEIKSIRERYS